MILKNPPFSAVEPMPGMDLYFARVGQYRLWFYLPVFMPENMAAAKVEAFKRGEQVYVEFAEIVEPPIEPFS